jgi:hypothetical protein
VFSDFLQDVWWSAAAFLLLIIVFVLMEEEIMDVNLFPAGLRVLAVDDDRTGFLILERQLQLCNYNCGEHFCLLIGRHYSPSSIMID